MTWHIGFQQHGTQDCTWSSVDILGTTKTMSGRCPVLCSSPCPRYAILRRYLQLSLDQDRIKAQDVHTVIGVVCANPIGHLVTWHFLKTHWDSIYNL